MARRARSMGRGTGSTGTIRHRSRMKLTNEIGQRLYKLFSSGTGHCAIACLTVNLSLMPVCVCLYLIRMKIRLVRTLYDMDGHSFFDGRRLAERNFLKTQSRKPLWSFPNRDGWRNGILKTRSRKPLWSYPNRDGQIGSSSRLFLLFFLIY